MSLEYGIRNEIAKIEEVRDNRDEDTVLKVTMECDGHKNVSTIMQQALKLTEIYPREKLKHLLRIVAELITVANEFSEEVKSCASLYYDTYAVDAYEDGKLEMMLDDYSVIKEQITVSYEAIRFALEKSA